ncbi:enduracididine biosynthesis enzyme MppR [Microbispora sp. NEAU-D428]|uniref:enduracididine biosynthesis enzyme MppR n=1 Tax=Microbispora sitophila TaxID=2771537 RepID=UPI001868DB41|nr:enduracididine biosynthesis enzyme MppR [Microbispora sitophila]MBE3015913.1 enduracididine biosynthesis enzyme MppR [Microbispora sitophila]
MLLTEPGGPGPHGYSLPLSPSGESAMVSPPPWHFSGDVIMVEYRTDPDVAAAFLPPGVDPGPDPGAAAAVFAHWHWRSETGQEAGDPARSQFSEFLILLGCTAEGRPMARCPYAWVDSAVPMARGWIQGMPKQFGAVHLTHPKAVGRTGPHLAEGGVFHGVASQYGCRIARASVTLSGRVAEPPALHAVPLVHTRHFPAWVPPEEPLSQLVVSAVDDVRFGEIWSGQASLDFAGDLQGDLAALRPVEVGGGFVFSYSETLRHGRALSGEAGRG